MINLKNNEKILINNLKTLYKTYEEAFFDGSYLYASYSNNNEIKGASLILMGFVEKGIEILNFLENKSNFSEYFLNYGNWVLSKDVKINGQLQLNNNLTLPSLNTLIGNKIKVLVFNNTININYKLLSEDFEILTVGYSEDCDVFINFSTKYHDLKLKLDKMNFIPDFCIVFRPEYFPMFNGFQEIPYPKIAFLTDFDMHLYQKYKEFNLFDKFVVLSSAEHLNVKKIMKKDVYTFCLSFSDIDEKTKIKKSKKEYDVLFTGSLLKPYFKEKIKFVTEIATYNEKLNILMVDGFLPTPIYSELVSKAKIIPSYVRFHGTFSTRVLESYLSKAGSIYQKNNIFDYFFSEKDNFFTYGYDSYKEDVENAVENFKNNINLFVPKPFKKKESFIRFLKFCKFISVENKQNNPVTQENIIPKVVGDRGIHGAVTKIFNIKNLAEGMLKIINYCKGEKETSELLNQVSITYYYLYQLTKNHGLKDSFEKYKKLCLNSFKNAYKKDSDNLAISFNYSRILFVFNQLEKSKEIFKKILENSHKLKFNELCDDIMSPLFFEPYDFIYRDYVDSLVEKNSNLLKTQVPKNIILSGCCYYLMIIYYQKKQFKESRLYGEKGLEYYSNNGNILTKIIELYYCQYLENKNNNLLSRIKETFEQSINENPFSLHENIYYYCFALGKLKKIEEIKIILFKWFLLFKRCTKMFLPLDVNITFLKNMLIFENYMPTEMKIIFREINVFFEKNETYQIGIFTEKVLLNAYFNENKIYQLIELFKKNKYKYKLNDINYYLIKNLSKIENIEEKLKDIENIFEVLDKTSDHNVVLHDVYNFASSLESINMLNEAFEIFKKISEHGYYKEGTSFHLGNICYLKKDFKNAYKYFKLCLKENNEHNRAAELINLIKLNIKN